MARTLRLTSALAAIAGAILLIGAGGRVILDAIFQGDPDLNGYSARNAAGYYGSTASVVTAMATNLTAGTGTLGSATIGALTASTASVARGEFLSLSATNADYLLTTASTSRADRAEFLSLSATNATFRIAAASTSRADRAEFLWLAATNAGIRTATMQLAIGRFSGAHLGDAAGLTNVIPSRWAVFYLNMDEWWDVHLKASTNAFVPPSQEAGKVFAYSTADPDGSTAWALIPSGTLPYSYGLFERTTDTADLSMAVARPHRLSQTSENGFWENANNSGTVAQNQGVVICVPAAGIIHPTNRLFWAVLRAGATTVETNGAGAYFWRWVTPEWVDHDPRPDVPESAY